MACQTLHSTRSQGVALISCLFCFAFITYCLYHSFTWQSIKLSHSSPLAGSNSSLLCPSILQPVQVRQLIFFLLLQDVRLLLPQSLCVCCLFSVPVALTVHMAHFHLFRCSHQSGLSQPLKGLSHFQSSMFPPPPFCVLWSTCPLPVECTIYICVFLFPPTGLEGVGEGCVLNSI